jgi:hypothetical protein
VTSSAHDLLIAKIPKWRAVEQELELLQLVERLVLAKQGLRLIPLHLSENLK